MFSVFLRKVKAPFRFGVILVVNAVGDGVLALERVWREQAGSRSITVAHFARAFRNGHIPISSMEAERYIRTEVELQERVVGS